MDNDIAQDLAKLRKYIAAGKYKKAEAIVDSLGKGLTTHEAKKKRIKKIRNHLKETGDHWFLPLLYVKHSIERNNMIVALYFLEALNDKRRYPKQRKQITQAFEKFLGPLAEKFSHFVDNEFDWQLLNWTD